MKRITAIITGRKDRITNGSTAVRSRTSAFARALSLFVSMTVAAGSVMADPRDFRVPDTRSDGNGLQGAAREQTRDGGAREEVRPAATSAQENGARQYARGTAVQTDSMPVYSSRADGNFVFSGNATQMSAQFKDDLRAAFQDAAVHGDRGAIKLMDAIGANAGDAGNGHRVSINFTPPTNGDPSARGIAGTNSGTVTLNNGGAFTVNSVSDRPSAGGPVALGGGPAGAPAAARVERDGGNTVNNGRDYARGTPVQTGMAPVYEKSGTHGPRPFTFNGPASEMSGQMKSDLRAAFQGAAEAGDAGSIKTMNAIGWNESDSGNGGRITIDFQVPTGGATAGDRAINQDQSNGSVVTLNNGASFDLRSVTDPNATAAAPIVGGGAAPARGGGLGAPVGPPVVPVPGNAGNAPPAANGGPQRQNARGHQRQNAQQPQANGQGAQNAQVRGAAGWALNQNGGGNAVVQPGQNGAVKVTATFNQLSPEAQQQVRAIAGAAGNGGVGVIAAAAQAVIDSPNQSFNITVVPAQNGQFAVRGVETNNVPANAAVGQAAGFAVAPPQAGQAAAPVAAQPLANGNVMLTMRAVQLAPAARQQLQQVAGNANAPAGARAAATAVLNARPDQMITVAVNPTAAGGPRVMGADRAVANAVAPQAGNNQPVAQGNQPQPQQGNQAQPQGGQNAVMPNPAVGLINPNAGGVVLVAQQRSGAIQVTGSFNQLSPQAQEAVNALPATNTAANAARLDGRGYGTFTFTRGNDGTLRAQVTDAAPMARAGAPGDRVLNAAAGNLNAGAPAVGMIRPDGKIQLTTTAGNLTPALQQQVRTGGLPDLAADAAVTVVVTPANGAAQPARADVFVLQAGQAAATPAALAINADARGVLVVQPQANGQVNITGNVKQLSPQLQQAVQAKGLSDGPQSAAGQAANGARMTFTLTPDAANSGQMTLAAVQAPQIAVAANLTQGLLNNANAGPVIVQPGANPNLTEVTVNAGALTDAGRHQLQQAGIQVPDNASTPITLTIDTSVRGRPQIIGPNGGGLQQAPAIANQPAAQNPNQAAVGNAAAPRAAVAPQVAARNAQQAAVQLVGGRPGTFNPVPGQPNQVQAQVAPSQMGPGFKGGLLRMAQQNPDQRMAFAVNNLLTNNGNRPLTVTLKVENGVASVVSLAVPQGNRSALTLAVNAGGALVLAPNNAAPQPQAGRNNPNVNNVPAVNQNLGPILSVPLNNLRTSLFIQNMPANPPASLLNTRNVGGQFSILLSRGPTEFRGIQNNPGSNYSQAVKILASNGYNAATHRFAAPPPGAAAQLQQAWRLLNDLRH